MRRRDIAEIDSLGSAEMRKPDCPACGESLSVGTMKDSHRCRR